MNVLTLNTVFLLVYIGLFVWQCVRCNQSVWLISSLVVWLVLGVCSAWVLPMWCGPFKWANLYVSHFYMFAGSLAVLLTRQHGREHTSLYLDLLLRSGIVLHASWLILLAVSWWQYPQGLSVMFANSMIQLYLWQPVFWLSSQWILMLIWWLVGLISADKTRKQSWQVGLLLVLLWQAAYGFTAYLSLVLGHD